MSIFFWQNSNLKDWVLIYEGEMPPLEDISSIEKAKGFYDLYRDGTDRFYFQASSQQAKRLKKNFLTGNCSL